MTDHNHDENDRPSRTQRKREAEDLQTVGERLLVLPESKLAQLPLPASLLDAVRVGRGLGHRGALRRQKQYIGKLMRSLDTEALQQALAQLDHQETQEQAHFHAAENWRDRLLNDGNTALEAFFDAYPHADRQRLRQLVQASVAEVKAGKPPRHRRELFREVRRVLEGEN